MFSSNVNRPNVVEDIAKHMDSELDTSKLETREKELEKALKALDKSEEFPLIISNSRIEVVKDGTEELTVWSAAAMKGEKETKEEVLPEETEPQHSSALADTVAIVSLGIGILIIFMIGAAGYKKF